MPKPKPLDPRKYWGLLLLLAFILSGYQLQAHYRAPGGLRRERVLAILITDVMMLAIAGFMYYHINKPERDGHD